MEDEERGKKRVVCEWIRAYNVASGEGKRSQESKSGELIVARAADEAAAIYGSDLWAARIYQRGHTHTRMRCVESLFLSPPPTLYLSSLSLLRARRFAAQRLRGRCDCTETVEVVHWVADNGNKPRKGESTCTREKDRKQRERKGERGDEG